MSATDRQSIGVTARGSDLLERMTDLGWFPEAQDAARFCLAYAVRAGVPAGTTDGTSTRWTVSLFDHTGEIRTLLEAVYPDSSTPVRLMEHLVNEGLLLLEPQLTSGDLSPADLFVDSPSTEPRS